MIFSECFLHPGILRSEFVKQTDFNVIVCHLLRYVISNTFEICVCNLKSKFGSACFGLQLVRYLVKQ